MIIKTETTRAESNFIRCAEPLARDEMTIEDFDAIMGESLKQAKAGNGIPLKEAFHTLRKCL